MFNFKHINTKLYGKEGFALTPDNLYWKNFNAPVLVKEYGAIDYIDFSQVEPHCFAITCSVRVQIYNPITKLVVKNLSKFQKNAYGGTFRSDGKLLIAGDEDRFVKLFDVSTRSILRSFNGHKGPVHRTFFMSNMIHVASFSDDKTVKLWDIPSEKILNTFAEHTDYIRAGAVSPVSPHIILSGGYDKIIKMYDTRTNSSIFEVKHDSPVESLIFLPTGGVFLSAGGTEIKVWDALMGGKLMTTLSHHHKTVTSLCLGNNGDKIFSGGLDRHVKIYNVQNYQVVCNLDFPSAVLSLGVAKDNSTLVVGMVDGLVSIHRREDLLAAAPKEERTKIKKLEETDQFDEVLKLKTWRETKYNRHLRKFQYGLALKSVMNTNTQNRAPQIIISVVEELIRRKGLMRAIQYQDYQFIAKFVLFLNRYVSEVRFTRIIMGAIDILLNVYENQFDRLTGSIGDCFIQLSQTLKREEQLIMNCLTVVGQYDLIKSGAQLSRKDNEVTKKITTKLIPTYNANQHIVIHID